MIAVILGIPVFAEYFETGLVPKFPSLIVSMISLVLSLLLFITTNNGGTLDLGNGVTAFFNDDGELVIQQNGKKQIFYQANSFVGVWQASGLTITLDGTTHVWKVQDIYYAEVINHHVSLYTNSGVFSFRGSLRELMAQLPDRWFSAPHQSYIINLLHVKSVSFQTVYLTDGTDIPVSRRKQREFTQSFHRFLGV